MNLSGLQSDGDASVSGLSASCVSIDGLLCSTDAARVSVCPPVALHSGLGLLCGLLKQWRQVPAGILVLTAWLLGEEDRADQASSEEFSGLVRTLVSLLSCSKTCALTHFDQIISYV